jgi:hypothetical protein
MRKRKKNSEAKRKITKRKEKDGRETKRSEKKNVGCEKKWKNLCEIFVETGKTEAKRVPFRFISLWSEKTFEAKRAHPTFGGKFSFNYSGWV